MALVRTIAGADVNDPLVEMLLKAVATADMPRLSACCKALRNRLRFRVGYLAVDRHAAALQVAVPPWQPPRQMHAWRWATVHRRDTPLHPQWCATFARGAAAPLDAPPSAPLVRDAPPEPWNAAPQFEGVVLSYPTRGAARGSIEEEAAFHKPLNGGKYGGDRWYRRTAFSEFVLPMCVTTGPATVERTRNTIPTRNVETGLMNKHPDFPEMYHPTISYDVVKETRTLGYAIDPEWSFADSYDFVPGGDPENCVIESLPRGTPLQPAQPAAARPWGARARPPASRAHALRRQRPPVASSSRCAPTSPARTRSGPARSWTHPPRARSRAPAPSRRPWGTL